MLIDQVRAFCLQHSLLEPGPLVVAVSGGADSLTLLHVLLALRDEFGLALHVATFDHRIRGDASAADVRFVQDIAAHWGVPVTVGSEDVPALAKKRWLNLEATARDARFAFFRRVAAQIGTTRIALGHNQDDQAETVLMHAIRGSGLAGLRGMRPRSIVYEPGPLILVRPLLNTPRADIDQYMRDLGIQPRIDQTNADPHYTRNRLRHEILPLLETINPQVRRALARTAELARDEYAILQSTLPPLKPSLNGLCIARTVFLALSEAQQRFLIRLAVQQLTPAMEISFEQTLAAVALVETPRHGARMLLGKGLTIRMVNDTLIIGWELPYPASCPLIQPGARLDIPGPGMYALPGSGWRLRVERMPESEPGQIQPDPLSVALAAGDSPRCELRTRQHGDRFRPHGAGGHSQKLSDTLTNMKVEAGWRDSIPLLTIDGEIAWFVAPFVDGPRSRVSERFALREPSESRAKSHAVWLFANIPPDT